MNSYVCGEIKIGALAKELGITVRTIRYYEQIGLLVPPQRTSGSNRSYDEETIKRLKFILKLKELGISLKEMEGLAASYDLNGRDNIKCIPNLLIALDRHISKIDEKVSKLFELRKEINGYRFRMNQILTDHSTLKTEPEVTV